MATRTVKARVELDGEKQYKQALSELNSANKVLSSEMKKLQAEYKGNADSVEFLRKKGDLLERQLLSQKDKVKALQDAVAASAKKYGEADKRTQDWVIKLNNAEAAQYDLEHAIEENNQAIDKQGKEMQGAGDAVSDLASKLGINIPKGARDALNGMGQFSAGTVAKLGLVAAAVAAVVKAVKELHETTLEAAANADEIITDSMVTGLSTQTLQQLKYAENLIDVSASTITGSLTKLTKNIVSAASGNTALADSFKKLGVSIVNEADGSLRSAEAVFYDLIDALGAIENTTERDAVSMEMFGKSAQELNPIIIQGTDTLRKYMDAANDYYVLTDEELAQLGAVDDAVQQQTLTWEALKNKIAVQFAPASKDAIEAFTGLVQDAGKALVDSKIIENLAAVLQSLIDVFKTVTDLLGSFPGFNNGLETVSNGLKGLAIVLATVSDAARVLVGLLQMTNVFTFGQGLENVKSGLGMNMGSGQLSATQRAMGYGNGNYYNASTGLWEGNYYSGNATGNANWRGGLTWVGESGPELVALPSGTQIMNAQESRSVGDTWNITIDAKNVKEFNDIIRIVESMRITNRMK